ncbi:hypothetical protein BKA65DRAFT_585821 [Rhexocercosporidium sp. MPI-PUGE-AT-0058]|nr:hypothetical protein BKA65DRAFT_585821 [Rhexocercosporidium sp. MPI-PUGE-AT-0058]
MPYVQHLRSAVPRSLVCPIRRPSMHEEDERVIPGALAYGPGADWPKLEFLLLRDSRHAIACAEVSLDWWDRGRGGFEVVVVGISHPAEGNAFDTEQTSKRAGTSAGQKQRAVTAPPRRAAMERISGHGEMRSGWLQGMGGEGDVGLGCICCALSRNEKFLDWTTGWLAAAAAAQPLRQMTTPPSTPPSHIRYGTRYIFISNDYLGVGLTFHLHRELLAPHRANTPRASMTQQLASLLLVIDHRMQSTCGPPARPDRPANPRTEEEKRDGRTK